MSEGAGQRAKWAFDTYEAVRHRLPGVRCFGQPKMISGLLDVADQYDVFLLDAFGVLNVGEHPIAGAPEQVAELQRSGKHVVVLSNAASYPKRVMSERLAALGFKFPLGNLFSSCQLLLEAVQDLRDKRFSVMLPRTFGLEEFGDLQIEFLEDDASNYSDADVFLLLGSAEWTDSRQQMLEDALLRRPRQVLVGNPDIVAPRETGLTKEPGYFAHHLADATGVVPTFFGKPFGNMFEFALSKIPDGIPRNRVVMVGDTLHTDILGARAAGIASVLVTAHGALKGLEPNVAMDTSAIWPDYIANSI